MKYSLNYSHTFIAALVLLIACGPSEEQQQQQEQARQDSLEQARQDSLEQLRQDSLAKVQADSLAKTEQDETGLSTDFSFTEDGRFAIQVEAWRSRQKAQARADQWKDRGFSNATVVQYGNKETGNIWFRVRLGQLDSREAAQQLQQALQEEYQTNSWIAAI